jgi:hypothetical protein
MQPAPLPTMPEVGSPTVKASGSGLISINATVATDKLPVDANASSAIALLPVVRCSSYHRVLTKTMVGVIEEQGRLDPATVKFAVIDRFGAAFSAK